MDKFPDPSLPARETVASEDFFLPRRGSRDLGLNLQMSEAFSDFRNCRAYIVLGEPGAGKTELFKHEAGASGGFYVEARNFTLYEAATIAGRTVFIDGLDERRAGGQAGRALNEVLEHLITLGKPPFRLSCREADWLGQQDEKAVKAVLPDGEEAVVFHLEPLNRDDMVAMLRHLKVANPEAFIATAERHRLEPLLGNPQTLILLERAVRKGWPKTRLEVYGSACDQLARELNKVHQGVSTSRPQTNQIIAAAGFLCATMLLSGRRSFGQFDTADESSNDRILTSELINPEDLPLQAALKSGLFIFVFGDEGDRTYIHRSVAEYLAGSYLAKRIEVSGGLPVERVLSACTGEGGGVSTDLRGMCAWLAALSQKSRTAFIARDPLALVLYGDVAEFSTQDKVAVLEALRREAARYPAFRAEERAAAPFGALASKALETHFASILRTPGKSDAEQVFVGCVLDAIRHGEPLRSLTPALEKLVRNPAHSEMVRLRALAALQKVAVPAEGRLLSLLADVQSGKVKDPEDQVLARLLDELYPGAIAPGSLIDYLHPPKNRDLIGDYYHFWASDLARSAPTVDLPILLEAAISARSSSGELASNSLFLKMIGGLLASTLKAHGDQVSPEEVYRWLTLGRTAMHVEDHLEDDDKEEVAEWLAARPELYKTAIRESVEDCRKSKSLEVCLRSVRAPVYGAAPPSDLVDWYFAMAAGENDPVVARYYFQEGVFTLGRQSPGPLGDSYLTALEAGVGLDPRFAEWVLPFIWESMDSSRRQWWLDNRAAKLEDEMRAREAAEHFRKYEAEIALGTAPIAVMVHLAAAYDGKHRDARGEEPRARLEQYVGPAETALVEAALKGVPRVLDRSDLPTVEDVFSLMFKPEPKVYTIRAAVLLAMRLRFNTVSDAAALSHPNLDRAIALWLSKEVDDAPDWIKAAAGERPSEFAAVLSPYLERALLARREHVALLWSLGYDDSYADAARLTSPRLLQGFPDASEESLAKRYLPPLMRAALRFVPDGDVRALVAAKLTRPLDEAQKGYWLTCGLLADAANCETAFFDYVAGSESRLELVVHFLRLLNNDRFATANRLTETALARLIRLLAPDVAPWSIMSGDDSRLVNNLVNELERRGTLTAIAAFEAMLDEPRLKPWNNAFRASINTIQVTRRQASFKPLSPRGASMMLGNAEPASAADLAAVTASELRALAYKIQQGSTKDFRLYWEGGKPKEENDCRDVLLSQLQERLDRYGVAGSLASREGNVALDQRADILVTYGSRFAVPIEAKVESYRADGKNVWTALQSQLVQRYAPYPTADGHGIYLVFWFGRGVPRSPSGFRPARPDELEVALRAQLTPSDGPIEVVVIDCSQPMRVAAAPPARSRARNSSSSTRKKGGSRTPTVKKSRGKG